MLLITSRDYKSVPPLRSDDNVIPQASEIVSNLRNPRKRTISVGPQSEADAREFIANRAQRRRDSRDSGVANPSGRRRSQRRPSPPTPAIDDATSSPESPSYMDAGRARHSARQPFLQVSAADPNLLTPPASDGGMSSDSGREDERNDREMFSSLEKPRTRYDVEVITKIVVYAGIGWWAVEGDPLLFRLAGVA